MGFSKPKKEETKPNITTKKRNRIDEEEGVKPVANDLTKKS